MYIKLIKMKIQLEDSQKIWFTADSHFNHSNICYGSTNWKNPDGTKQTKGVRMFNTLHEMNTAITTNINSTVGEDDVLIHLGDWSFGGKENVTTFRNHLICKNIHLILGNHDHHIEREVELKKLFTSVHEKLTLELGKTTIICSHEPIASWTGWRRDVIHLAGHLHSSMVGPGKFMDVGMDGHPEFRPYELSEILSLMEKQEKDCFLNNLHKSYNRF